MHQPLDQSRAGELIFEDNFETVTGWTEITGLAADSRYTIRAFLDGNPAGPEALVKTLPDSTALRDPKHNPRGLFNFSFTAGSCANQNPLHGIGPSLPTYATLLRQHADLVDFQIMNGDWLYEELREYSPET